MLILNNNLSYADRLKMNIFRNESNLSISADGGYYILAKNAVLNSDFATAKGCFVGYTNNNFDISGDFVVIEIKSINYQGTVIREVTPGTHGDLSYIDGCSNSLLISPNRNGEPCVNYLHFPKNIIQTSHTHPSIRLGMVFKGKGKAIFPDKKVNLKEGDVFLMDRHVLHNFSTDNKNEMSLVVFHPDSDSGPTDEFNPMITRTYIKK